MICSNTSSLPEIAQDSAILIDPYDTGALKEAIEKLDKDDSLRKELSEKSVRQAGRFSWERTAAQTLNVYQEVLK